MVKKSIKVGIPSTTDARSLAMIVQLASQYDSKIYIEHDNKQLNAKSIMGMMTLVLKNGEDILVSAEGKDEDLALDRLEKYLTNN